MNPKMVTLEQLQSEGTILLGRIRDFMDSGVDTLELEISDKFDGAYVDGGYLILCKGSQKLQLGPFASGDSDLPEVTIADNGKVLKVVNGVWAKGIDATGGGESYDDTELRGRISAIENKESGWNAKYIKPNGGIPKTDLASAVQSSLNKADNALQSVPNTYRTASAQDVIDSGKLSDAPSDGKQYARKNGAWTEVISGGGGTSDHRQLTHRNDADQHSISAITGLQSALNGKLDASEIKLDPNSRVYKIGTSSIAAEFDGNGAIISSVYAKKTELDNYAKKNDLDDKQDKALIVNITESGGTYVADKTNAEIDAAWLANKEIFAVINGDLRLQCVESAPLRAVFSADTKVSDIFNITVKIANNIVTIDEAAFQPKTITDYEGYFTEKTVEGALAEIGGTLDGLEDIVDEKLSDAPSDGKQYARKNGAWSEVISSGGGGVEVFIVAITESGGTATADKTNAEIYAAVQGGRMVCADLNGSRISLVSASATFAIFADTAKYGDVSNITVTITNNVVGVETTNLLATDEYGNIVLNNAGIALMLNSKGIVLSGSNPDGTPFLTIEDVNDPDEPVVINGVAAPVVRTQAANKGYVDENLALISSDLDDKQDKALIVNITQSGGVFSADKTNAEIYAAAQANNIVIAIITVSGSRMPLLSATSTKAVFADTMRTQDVHNGTLTIENNVVTAVDTELQSAKISDDEGYYTDKTVEGALAEIGAKLAAYPSEVWEGGSYGS